MVMGMMGIVGVVGGEKRMWCPDGGRCKPEWALEYLQDCICSPRDAFSLGLGLLSVISWGVAEVPQIVTNFRHHSTEGVSLTFLMTWVIGDVFNLAGCYLEPATLPTQFYMALLYTITTLVLVFQTIYYNHMKNWWRKEPTAEQYQAVIIDDNDDLKTAKLLDATNNTTNGSDVELSSAEPINEILSPNYDLYYMSARSLASSHTPPAGSYLSVSRGSGKKAMSHFLHSPYDEPALLESMNSSHSSIDSGVKISHPSPPINTARVLRGVVSIALCVGGLNIPLHMRASNSFFMIDSSGPTTFQVFRRKLLQEQLWSHPLISEGEISGQIGIALGWLMAAIYMGGRLPQIWMNIKRGTIEGLNPLMFVFALMGNVTYVGSILVRSCDWERIKANSPWLVDAVVCVFLDFLILLQFLYYIYFRSKRHIGENDKTKC